MEYSSFPSSTTTQATSNSESDLPNKTKASNRFWSVTLSLSASSSRWHCSSRQGISWSLVILNYWWWSQRSTGKHRSAHNSCLRTKWNNMWELLKNSNSRLASAGYATRFSSKKWKNNNSTHSAAITKNRATGRAQPTLTAIGEYCCDHVCVQGQSVASIWAASRSGWIFRTKTENADLNLSTTTGWPNAKYAKATSQYFSKSNNSCTYCQFLSPRTTTCCSGSTRPNCRT